MMFALFLASIFLLPLGVGASLALLPAARRRRATVLRVLLTLSLVPWLSFLSEMLGSASTSLTEYPSLTPSLFIRAAAPSTLLALAVWTLALLYARRFPMWVTGLPIVVSVLATASTLGGVRSAALVFTPEGEPDSGFYFDGLYAFWLLVYSCAAWPGLATFVGLTHRLSGAGERSGE